MKEKYEKQIKRDLLEILDFFVSICKENNLTYYLGEGTLLGAIRHNGFIPWDDDIDIYMPRKDYEKLLNLKIESPKFWLDNYKTNKKSWCPYSKMRYLNTIYEEKYVSNYNEPQGIWIDIFPIDNTKNNILSFVKFRKLIVKICFYILFYKYSKKLNNLKSLTINKKIVFIISRIVPRKIVILTREFLMKYENNENNPYYIGFTSKYSSEKQLHLKNKIFPLKNHIFEKKEYSIPKDSDYILKKIYGNNYMQIPKESERETHQPVRVKLSNNEEYYFGE